MEAEDLNHLAAHLDRILEELVESAEPEVARGLVELVDGLQRVHGEGLRRAAELLAREPELLDEALSDPAVSNLFYLYDLAVVDAEERARDALESASVMARSHGGELELLEVEDGVVRLRVHWSHDAVSREPETLREGIEWALRERLPGFRGLEIEGLDVEPSLEERGYEGPRAEEVFASDDGYEPPSDLGFGDDGPVDVPPGSVPGPGGGSGGADGPVGGREDDAGASEGGGIDAGRSLPVIGDRSVVPEENVERMEERVRRAKEGAAGRGARADRSPRRVEVVEASDLPEGHLQGNLVEGYPVLLLRAEDGIRAYRNACPGSMLPLHFGDLEGGRIVCPWHGCRFGAATGEREGEEGPPLLRLECGVDGGRIWVTVPAGEGAP